MTHVTASQADPVRSGGLEKISRPSGAFAMLAVDQREAMRAMFAEHQDAPVTDQQLTDFKVAATRVISPYASAVLVDKQFAFDRSWTPTPSGGCGLIAAADHFIAGNGEFVTAVEIDHAVDPAAVRDQGAVAMKLLVIHRPDEPAAGADRHGRGVRRPLPHSGTRLASSNLSPRPREGGGWDWDACVIEAAQELGTLGADLYKAEVPLKGSGAADEIRRRCAQITAAVISPWVVLSSGVAADLFPWPSSSPAAKAPPGSSPAAPSGRRSSAATTSSGTCTRCPSRACSAWPRSSTTSSSDDHTGAAPRVVLVPTARPTFAVDVARRRADDARALLTELGAEVVGPRSWS